MFTQCIKKLHSGGGLKKICNEIHVFILVQMFTVDVTLSWESAVFPQQIGHAGESKIYNMPRKCNRFVNGVH